MMTFPNADISLATLRSRARGCLVGAAIGDTMGAPCEGMSAAEIRERYGRLTGFISDRVSGTDDTDFTLFNAHILLTYGADVTLAQVEAEWRDKLLAPGRDYRPGGFSDVISTRNLAAGLHAPQSGAFGHQMWSDGVAMAIGAAGVISPGLPAQAARLARVLGSISNARDGIYAAQAVAAAVSVAMVGASPAAMMAAALEAVPADSWTGRVLQRAQAVARRHDELDAALEAIGAELVVPWWPWADLATEAVPLAFAVFLAADGEYRRAVPAGISLGRDADTIGAIVGSLAGACGGLEAIPGDWQNRVRESTGYCIGFVAGRAIVSVADELADAAWQTYSAAAAAAREPRPETGSAGDSPDSANPSVRVSVSEPAAGRPVAGDAATPARPASRERVAGALFGLAYGDASGFPALFHRFHDPRIPGRRHNFLWRTNRELGEQRILRLMLPFTHRVESGTLEPCPGDDTEFALLTLEALLAAGPDGADQAAFVAPWTEQVLPVADRVLSGFSERAAIENLQRGLRPPATGNDNPLHYADAAVPRAVPIGLFCAGQPARAAALAHLDARITNAEDGVYAAQAMAAAIAVLAGGDSPAEALAAARRQLPAGSWIAHGDEIARRCLAEAVLPEDLGVLLSRRLINTVYSYGNAAPETFPAALVIVEAAAGDLRLACLIANSIPKAADSLPAMVGALCGAFQGISAISPQWQDALAECRGLCLPFLKGRRLDVLAERLAGAAGIV